MVQRPDLESLRDQVSRGVADASGRAANEAPESTFASPPTPTGSGLGGKAVAAIAFVGLLLIIAMNSSSNQSTSIPTKEVRRSAPPTTPVIPERSILNIPPVSVPPPRENVASGFENRPSPEQPRNPAVKLQLRNKHWTSVTFAFFSALDHSRTWSGGVLMTGKISTNQLSCVAGERVCYGAWIDGQPLGPYWGVGRNGDSRCSSCCVVCGQDSPIFDLQTSDASYLSPTLTWHVQNNYPGTIAISFYSRSRQYEWPGGGQSYVLSNLERRSFSINCQHSEKICYGAWVHRNSYSGGWGVGINGRGACSNCCYDCNGGDTRVIALNP
jgi:hypothetical protein